MLEPGLDFDGTSSANTYPDSYTAAAFEAFSSTV
jgi:hypothetical protein